MLALAQLPSKEDKCLLCLCDKALKQASNLNLIEHMMNKMRMPYKNYIAICLLALLCPLLAQAQSLSGRKPNIVLILTDDQGYGQLGCQGHPWLETPNLDQLNRHSTVFSDFHASPTCSPTRAALMTGNVPFKSGVTSTGGGRERMALAATTLPQYLKKAGYTSGVFGKWHLGDPAEYQPEARGFDEVFIHGSGGIGQPMDAPDNEYLDPVIRHNGTFVKTKGFCTDVFFTQALGWIREQKDKPFFAFISTNAPHGPFIAPPNKRKKFQEYGFHANQTGFYGMIENIDENVGRLMACLKKWDLEKNTLVIFMSDNGFVIGGTGKGNIGTRNGEKLIAYHAGLKGNKKTVYEGGTKVPALFYWKGVLEEGAVSKALTAHIDLLPTLIELAGGEVPADIDGKSLLPLLENAEAPWPDRNLFFHVGRWPHNVGPDRSKYDKKAGFAVRNARYRLINNEELYDILIDPGETRNLYAEKPELVNFMMEAYDKWWDEVRPSLVNDGAPRPKINSYKIWYEEQIRSGGIPASPFRSDTCHLTVDSGSTSAQGANAVTKGKKSLLITNLEAGKKQTVVTYGTSLTAVGAWVDQLRSVFEQNYPGQVNLINSGSGGSNSDWGRKNFEERVIQKKPDTVFIEFAVNDAVARRRTSVEHAQANLEGMIDRLLKAQPDCEIILMVMNPPVAHTKRDRPNLAAYNQMYRDVAKERKLQLIDHYPAWEKILNEDPGRFLHYVPDAIHPVREGARDVITPAIAKAVGMKAGNPDLSKATPCWDYLFRMTDKDKSRDVSRVEFTQFWADHFSKQDTDQDNKLSAAEYEPTVIFNHVDANQDGQITLAEYQKIYVSHFDSRDKNKDDVLTKGEMWEPKTSDPKRVIQIPDTVKAKPLIVAHRGASRDAPENTLEAFKLAWEQGADAIEGDFHLTADGVIVCIHDGNTARVSGKNLVVRQSTLAELQELDVGAYRGEEFKGSVIPTLAEVFSTIPEQKKIYIEIKCGTEIIPALLEEIRKSGLKREQIVVISKNKKVVQELQARASQYKAYWLCNFKKDEFGTITPSLETVLEILGQVKADGFSSTPNIPEPVLKGVREHGYEWHVYTIDDLETARRIAQQGARSITTNVPGTMKKKLVEQAATANTD